MMGKNGTSRSSNSVEMNAMKERGHGSPSKVLLQEVVRRIVEAVHPEKVILFGSAAKGTMGPDSDLDLLVVKSGVNRRETSWTIRRTLMGLGIAKDIIVAHPEDLERFGSCPALVYYPALREGKVIYSA